MFEIVPCVFHGSELNRQASLAVGVSHVDGLIKRNEVVLFSVDKQQQRIILGDEEDGLVFRYNSGFSFSVPRKSFTTTWPV